MNSGTVKSHYTSVLYFPRHCSTQQTSGLRCNRTRGEQGQCIEGLVLASESDEAIHTITSHVLKIHFNVIPPYTPRFISFIHSRFPIKHFASFKYLSYFPRMPSDLLISYTWCHLLLYLLILTTIALFLLIALSFRIIRNADPKNLFE